MKRYLLSIICLVVVAALSIGGIILATSEDQSSWPDFNAPSNTSNSITTGPSKPNPLAPKVIPDAVRDYGWRIGDIIEVQLFIKQMPGTRVDTHSLAIEGDFDMISPPDYVTRDFKDGSRAIRVRFKIQSFQAKDQLLLKTSMVYRNLETGDDVLIEIPAFTPYTSKTWDGRDVIQGADPDYLHLTHLWITGGWILGGIAGAIFFFRLRTKLAQELAQEKRKEMETRRQKARAEFDAVWTRFLEGDYSDENYKEVERVLRRLFLIESQTRDEVAREMGEAHPYRKHTLAIMKLCGKVLYKQRALSETEHFRMKEIFDMIVPPSAPKESVA